MMSNTKEPRQWFICTEFNGEFGVARYGAIEIGSDRQEGMNHSAVRVIEAAPAEARIRELEALQKEAEALAEALEYITDGTTEAAKCAETNPAATALAFNLMAHKALARWRKFKAE